MRKNLKITYGILIGLMAGVAAALGVLCCVYDRVPEGVIIFGADVLALIIVFSVMRRNPDRLSTIVSAGNLITQLSCVCRFNDRHSVDCSLRLYQNGIIIDMDGVPFKLFTYDDVVLEDSKTQHHLNIRVRDVGVFQFVCNSKIKMRAIKSTLEARKS